jgi:hypothetical protein
MLESPGPNHSSFRKELQRRMTSSAGFIREAQTVRSGLAEAETARKAPISARDRSDLPLAWETRNLLLTSLAFLRTIDAYLTDGGGSRGAYLVAAAGSQRSAVSGESKVGMVDSAKGVIYTFAKERPEDRMRRAKVSGPDLSISWEPVRPLPTDDSWFETTWADWRKGSSPSGETE